MRVTAVPDVGVAGLCKLEDGLCLCGAGFLGVAAEQVSGHAGGSGHLGADFPQGVGAVQGVQLLLELCGLLVCFLQLSLACLLGGIELGCLAFRSS